MAQHNKAAVTKRWLWTTNIVTAALLIFLAGREHYFTRVYKRITGTNDTTITTPYDSYWRAEQMDLQQHYGSKATIVCLGTSLTFRVQWQELLQRCDVVNRGIPSDETAALLQRLAMVKGAAPKICFIEGGVNDITAGVPHDTIVTNVMNMARQLKEWGIVPVITTVPFASANCKEYIMRNGSIDALNEKLRIIAGKDSINIIDLARILPGNKQTETGYTTADGIHLSSSGYALWARAIEEMLKKEGLAGAE